MEEAKNIKIHLTRSARAVDLKLLHVPKNELQVTRSKSSGLQTYMRGCGTATYLCRALREKRILSLAEVI